MNAYPASALLRIQNTKDISVRFLRWKIGGYDGKAWHLEKSHGFFKILVHLHANSFPKEQLVG